jgi:hypothetical protein
LATLKTCDYLLLDRWVIFLSTITHFINMFIQWNIDTQNRRSIFRKSTECGSTVDIFNLPSMFYMGQKSVLILSVMYVQGS